MPMTPSDLIRTVTCARQRLDKGDACVCQCFGQGAGLGWAISVQCGGDDEIAWIQPARHPGEQLDNLRADEVAAENCFDYLASFFKDNTGKPMDVAARGDAGAWVETYCNQVTIPPGKLEAGDVVIFKGRGTIHTGPGEHVSHVGIATGHGDEISQLWFRSGEQRAKSREQRGGRGPRPRAQSPKPKAQGLKGLC